jgi:hypothetical protein
VQQGDKLLVLAGSKTVGVVDKRAALKQHVTCRDIQLVVVDPNELATLVEADEATDMGLRTNFFKSSSLYVQGVILTRSTSRKSACRCVASCRRCGATC